MNILILLIIGFILSIPVAFFVGAIFTFSKRHSEAAYGESEQPTLL